MAEPRADELKPTDKDPAEGARGHDRGAPATSDKADSHLGKAGDPVEGAAPPKEAGDPSI